MRSAVSGSFISMRTTLALVVVCVALVLVLAPWQSFTGGLNISHAQTRPPICLDPKGHLVWPGQLTGIIPMRSMNTVDTLANSPISVGASVVTVANSLNVTGDLSATGNVTGANLCLGAKSGLRLPGGRRQAALLQSARSCSAVSEKTGNGHSTWQSAQPIARLFFLGFML